MPPFLAAVITVTVRVRCETIPGNLKHSWRGGKARICGRAAVPTSNSFASFATIRNVTAPSFDTVPK
jgi:hypothetical protein